YGRNEVKCFLLSSALFWLEEYHIDGLRVDAVASMLYLDYSRKDWIPNRHGGNENLEAIDFLRALNEVTHNEVSGVLMMAEESTSWPQVSRPTYLGGLGFDMKWNMGWMNDTLAYMSHDPIHRRYHQDLLTFSMLYAYSENFLLPLSHDEVVHGKRALVDKMPGDDWQRFANLRLLFSFMFTFPGKKLLFMGDEFGQWREWDSERALDWHCLGYPPHQGISRFVRDLNRLYRAEPALHALDFEGPGFEWIDCHDANNSVLTYQRRGADGFVIVVLNFTPVPREGYRIGVPVAGCYQELLNSDSGYYGGSNLGNGDSQLEARAEPWMDQPFSLSLKLPPLGALVLAL
ncbi:MAG: 1,4-alpha-glucan branching enzyme, partial [Pseudomonadales bacterium]